MDEVIVFVQNFVDLDVLDGFQVEINYGNDVIRKFIYGKQLWIGEISFVWNGGVKGLLDGYVVVFM